MKITPPKTLETHKQSFPINFKKYQFNFSTLKEQVIHHYSTPAAFA